MITKELKISSEDLVFLEIDFISSNINLTFFDDALLEISVLNFHYM